MTGTPLSIAFVGDVMFARGVLGHLEDHPGSLLKSDLAGLLQSSDTCVANLEAPLATFAEPRRATSFKGSAARAWPTLVSFDVASLANNHVLDCGDEGVDETIRALESRDVRWVGMRRTATDDVPQIRIQAKGARVSLFSAALGELAPTGARWSAVEADARLLAAIANARTEGDAVVAMLHAGDEFVPLLSANLQRLVAQLGSAGAQLIVGHHQHVLCAPLAGDAWAYHGLGDFIFDAPVGDRVIGAVLKAEFVGDALVGLQVIITERSHDCTVALAGPRQVRRTRRRLRRLSALSAVVRIVPPVYGVAVVWYILKYQVQRLRAVAGAEGPRGMLSLARQLVRSSGARLRTLLGIRPRGR